MNTIQQIKTNCYGQLEALTDEYGFGEILESLASIANARAMEYSVNKKQVRAAAIWSEMYDAVFIKLREATEAYNDVYYGSVEQSTAQLNSR